MGFFDRRRERAMNRMLDRVVEEYGRQWQRRVELNRQTGGPSLTPEWLADRHDSVFRSATFTQLPERVRKALPSNPQVHGALQQTCLMRVCVDFELSPTDVQQAFEAAAATERPEDGFPTESGL